MKKIIVTALSIIMLFSTLITRADEPPHPIEWSVQNGILEVSGNGEIPDFKNPDEAPWYSEREGITEIRVCEGVTRIGNLAFYGLTNAKKITIPDSVQSIGLCALSYTEGTRTNISDVSSEYSFSIESDSSVVSKGTEFTVNLYLEADFKDISIIQAIVLFDTEKIAIDESKWYDSEWYSSINESNIGYIGKPKSGIVANNLRLAYISLDGEKIDSSSPLYDAGKTKLNIAKIRCTALSDIEDVNMSCFVIKNCAVGLSTSSGTKSPTCSMTQLTTSTRLPMSIEIVRNKNTNDTTTDITPETEETKPAPITVKANGVLVSYDTEPFFNEDGVVLVPLRHTAEALGGIVSWNNETRLALVYYNDEIIVVQIGQNLIFKNSGETPLDSDVRIKDGRTMVSIDYFEKALGIHAKLDTASNIITIQ